MIDVGKILTGWAKVMHVMAVSDAEQQLSNERLKICGTCDHAKPNKCLEFINGGATEVEGMYCGHCFCPCLQKSLTGSMCELGKWDNITTSATK